MRNPRSLISRALLLPRPLLPPPPPSPAAAAAAADRRIGGGPASSSPPRTRRWIPGAPAVAPLGSRTVPVGLAGALSLSLTLVTAAEAKEPPPPELVPKDVVLYQYEACPFCNKVRAFLDYHDIPYRVVEVNPLSKKEIKWSDYKKVPILVVDGEQLIDSSGSYKSFQSSKIILSLFFSCSFPLPSCTWFVLTDIINKLSKRISTDDFVIGEEEAKWRRWVDEHLVHLLSPNIYRTTSEALESFDYIAKHGNFSATERFTVKYAGAAAMYMVSKKLKKKYNITDERAALYEAAETWTKALDGKDFLGGSKPNLADLAVFGVLRPIRYLQAGRDMVDNTHIGEWYQRMENAVGEPSRIMA
ncbi:prostaglandin E synthase 2 isoform X1 [Ananas comosus]|uniref:Prostaglandin E synthase 2 n=1 Tax=Ananas comosus TaxID=4615 RepID=A0A6P5EP91_ANACO|nr:prostaglandin E synthase 2 isoform X1 [Ananas comosus]